MSNRTTTGSKRRTRGAILVEAVIVISTFVLLFMSMVFFRNMYIRKIQVARLARASVIAYSMQGCPDQDPTTWASADLDPSSTKSTPPVTQSQTPVPATEKTHSQRATDIMSSIPGAGSNGSQLNPIADIGFSLKAAATTKTSALGTRKGYTATMTSTSFVSCAEGIRGDDFKSVMHYALDRFNLDSSSCKPKPGHPCNASDEQP